MRVLLHPIDGCALVAASLVVPVGWRHDPLGLEGLAHLAEHGHFLGSESYPDADAVTRPFGTHLDGRALADVTTYHFTCLREHAAPMLDLLRDVVFRPTFDRQRLAHEREIVRSAMLVESEFAPWEWAALKVDDILFEIDGLASLGTPSSFARLARRHLLDWQARHYRPEACCLLLAGDSAAIGALEGGAGGRGPAAKGAADEGPLPPPVARTVHERAYRRHHPDQSPEMCLGFRFPLTAFGPAVELLRVLLGNYPGSRLWRRFRDEEAIAYTVDASLRLLADGGRLNLYVGVADVVPPERAWQALVALVRELRDAGPTPDEVEWARRVARLDLHRHMLDPERALSFLVSRYSCLAARPAAEGGPYGALMAGLEREDHLGVAHAAREVLAGPAAALGVVGNVGDWSLTDALEALPGV